MVLCTGRSFTVPFTGRIHIVPCTRRKETHGPQDAHGPVHGKEGCTPNKSFGDLRPGGGAIAPASSSPVHDRVLSADGARSSTPGDDRQQKQEDQPATTGDQPVPDEKLVLAYLRRHGLGNAASELQRILRRERDVKEFDGSSTAKKRKRDGEGEGDDTGGDGDNGSRAAAAASLDPYYRDDVTNDDEYGDGDEAFEAGGGSDHASFSTAITGASVGFGYDLNAAPAIAAWGAGYAPPSLRSQGTSDYLLEGRRRDEELVNNLAENGVEGAAETRLPGGMAAMRDEARRYVEGFTTLAT